MILPLLKDSGVIKAGLFGSLPGEKPVKEAPDILVRFRSGKSLFDLAALEIQLEKKRQEGGCIDL